MAKVVSVTEAASIGMHGMILIAESEELVNVQEIAEKTGASRHHVAKVFQRLVKQGWLKSHRGPTGGFTLKVDPKDLTFLDIYEAIEGEIEIQECPLDHQICAFDKCILNNVTSKMTRDFRKYLQKSDTGKLYKK
jgi:Rrf2 family protein